MKPRLLAGMLVLAMGTLLGAASVRADTCFGGGGNHDQKNDAATKDVALETTTPGKRQLGFGLLAAASVGTAWLSFRRRDSDD